MGDGTQKYIFPKIMGEENNICLIRIPYTEYDNLTLEYLLSFFPELSSSEI